MEWISVKDRLPDGVASYVLVNMSSGLVVSTFYCVDKNYFNQLYGTDRFGDMDEVSMNFEKARKYGYRVTHWMPLPKGIRKA